MLSDVTRYLAGALQLPGLLIWTNYYSRESTEGSHSDYRLIFFNFASFCYVGCTGKVHFPRRKFGVPAPSKSKVSFLWKNAAPLRGFFSTRL